MDNILENVDANQLIDLGKEMALKYGLKLLGAVVVLVAGLWVVKMINKGVQRFFDKKEFDPSLESFISSLLSVTLKILLVITVLSMMGVEMTSFVAILGAAGLAVGMALSGTLQNFAGGVIILLFKPFKVGDAIEAQGFIGKVKEIQIFNTIVTTFDNRIVIIPNGGLSNSAMINITKEDNRRTDWTFGIAYGDSYDTAKEVLQKLIKEDERILEDPAPFIAMHSLGDSSVNIVVRVWAAKDVLWDVHFDMNEKVYKAFPENGLSIPFPQMDVHVQNK